LGQNRKRRRAGKIACRSDFTGLSDFARAVPRMESIGRASNSLGGSRLALSIIAGALPTYAVPGQSRRRFPLSKPSRSRNVMPLFRAA
jgi:hypothetical protein